MGETVRKFLGLSTDSVLSKEKLPFFSDTECHFPPISAFLLFLWMLCNGSVPQFPDLSKGVDQRPGFTGNLQKIIKGENACKGVHGT